MVRRSVDSLRRQDPARQPLNPRPRAETLYVDAHFHADDLAAFEAHPGEAYASAGAVGLASVHDGKGLELTRSLLSGSGPYGITFGLHPQLPIMDEAPRLEALASGGALAAIGECGFDFYGDRPDTVRSPSSERIQREVFEFQLGLALRRSLPLVLHLRRAQDLLFEYAARLSLLPAVVLHSWAGPPNEAAAFLARCPRALFSFGSTLLNGNKKARASAAALPATSLLTETDAPYQPPREAPRPGARLVRGHSTFADLPRIIAELAALRGEDEEGVRARVMENFRGAFGHAIR